MTKKINEATSYAAQYQVIGQQLWVSDRLLGMDSVEKNIMGVKIAYDAAYHANDYAMNYWLASKIIEVYLYPNIPLVKQNPPDKDFLDNMFNFCTRVFQNADDTNNLISAYQLQINNTTNETRANYARYYLSTIYEQNGDLEKALYYLKQITNQTNFDYAIRRIPVLQAKLEKLQKK